MITCVLASMWIVVFVIIIKLTFVNGFTDGKQKELFMQYAKRALDLGIIDNTMFSPREDTNSAEIIADEIIREMRS